MINQIILSCNEDPIYSEFWTPVSYAYRKMFPEAQVHLAFLTNRAEDDELVKEMRTHGKVTLFKPVDDVPEFGQAKMIRFLLASMQGDDVCYIDDIDLFPLRRDFITNKTELRPPGFMLCVGGEVYNHIGSYPISQMTAEGHVWKSVVNPHLKTYRELMDEWSGDVMFDRRENIKIVNNFAVDDYFSDERLLRRLIEVSPVEIQKIEMERGYKDYAVDTIDRAVAPINGSAYNYDIEKLKAGGYVNAHCSRPYSRCIEEMNPLLEYIKTNY